MASDGDDLSTDRPAGVGALGASTLIVTGGEISLQNNRAVTVIEGMGARIIGPDEVRKKLKLTKR